MVTNRVDWWGQYSAPHLQYHFQAIKTTDSGRFAIYTIFEEVPVEPITDRGPTLAMEPEEAQGLFNAMWNAGLRPRDGTGGLAHTDAQQAHLEDLRTIAFSALEIKK